MRFSSSSGSRQAAPAERRGEPFPPASVSTPASPGTAGPSSSSRGTVSLHVVIPAGSGTSAHVRRPQFVSPATQSLAFSWPSISNQYGTSPSGSVVVPLTANSPGCSTGANGNRTCAVMIPVPAGFGVQFSVVTYEGSNGTGTALGYGTSLPIDILPGTHQQSFGDRRGRARIALAERGSVHVQHPGEPANDADLRDCRDRSVGRDHRRLRWVREPERESARARASSIASRRIRSGRRSMTRRE